MPQVKFINEKQTVEAQHGENLRQVALKNGIQLYSGPHTVVNCRGLGQCGSCNVAIRKGAENCNQSGGRRSWEKLRMLLGPLLFWKRLSYKEGELRLACCTSVNGDIEVETHPDGNWHGEKFWN
ncbi:MAG: ferredoxin [Planctomycetaceae bacterium]